MDDLVADFIAEAREGLEALDSELVRFEQQPDNPATLSGIFRLIHTIKGTCGFLGLMRLQSVAHAAENVLGAFRDGALPVTPAAVSAILETVDLIRALTDALCTTSTEPEGDDSVLIARLEALMEADAAPAAPAERAAQSDARSLIERLGGDATLDAAAETVVARLRSDDAVGALFSGVDPDLLQAAMRDCLGVSARKGERTAAFAQALSATAGLALEATQVETLFAMVGEALLALDVPATAVEQLAELVDAGGPRTPGMTGDPGVMTALVTDGSPAAPARTLAADSPSARGDAEGAGPVQTIRVSVDALEHLMTVVSELVLIRNQLIQTLRLEPESAFTAPLNRLNQVTSELQEGVMTTRMQPISGAWAKLPRLVRDLAQDLGKTIELVTHGQDTELDRQVLELIKDPLTHMIRNAADHGLETPAQRRAAGKAEAGRITLQARHEGGAIVIEVSDDGRGLPADKLRAKALACGAITPGQAEQMTDAEARQLIFLPGLSTAAEVTSVSGRGVGMDVVRTNIERIGGVIELASVEGGGTCFTIRIPLTLTIVSALIVECCGERFAMPQSSLVELVSASDGSGRAIEYIDGMAVLRLRDRLLPLVSLQALLQLEPVGEPSPETCIIVARVGAFTFGVIVDRVFDTEEIVVKPVATVLRHLKLYSGATILGDGSVILILDLKGISAESGAGQVAGAIPHEVEAVTRTEDLSALLVFRAANDSLKAAPLASVSRIEELSADQIERIDGRTVIQYRGRLTPIVDCDGGAAATWQGDERRPLLVFAREDHHVGVLVNDIVDIVESAMITDMGSAGAGVLGGLIIGGAATELIDIDYYWRQALQQEAAPAASPLPASDATGPTQAPGRRLLLIDQSPFSQLLLEPLLTQAGYAVTVAADPAAALQLYDAGQQFQLIMADTSDPAEARTFAQAFSRAENWHRTPLLSLAVHAAPTQAASGAFDRTRLLDAVSEAVSDVERAA